MEYPIIFFKKWELNNKSRLWHEKKMQISLVVGYDFANFLFLRPPPFLLQTLRIVIRNSMN